MHLRHALTHLLFLLQDRTDPCAYARARVSGPPLPVRPRRASGRGRALICQAGLCEALLRFSFARSFLLLLPAIFFAQFNALWPVRHRFKTVFSAFYTYADLITFMVLGTWDALISCIPQATGSLRLRDSGASFGSD